MHDLPSAGADSVGKCLLRQRRRLSSTALIFQRLDLLEQVNGQVVDLLVKFDTGVNRGFSKFSELLNGIGYGCASRLLKLGVKARVAQD